MGPQVQNRNLDLVGEINRRPADAHCPARLMSDPLAAAQPKMDTPAETGTMYL